MAAPTPSRGGSGRSSPRSTRQPPTGTRKSCRSGWPSSPAVSRSSRWARPQRPSSRRRSTAWKTPGRPRVPQSETASSPGANILRGALEEPLRQIATNAGAEGSVVVEKVKSLPKGQGYNAATGEYVDMVKAGIIDPTKVTRSAVQNAASIAGLLLTTEVLVTDIPEKRAAAAPPMPEY